MCYYYHNKVIVAAKKHKTLKSKIFNLKYKKRSKLDCNIESRAAIIRGYNIISSFCGNCSLPVGDMEVVNSLGGGEEKGSFHESK